MNVTVLIRRERDGEIKGVEEEKKGIDTAFNVHCPCAVQKCLDLMGDKHAQPPEGCTSNYAT